jgi:Zn-dependent protease
MIHLGSIGKTSIDIDFSFLILIALFVASYYNPKQGIQYALLWIPVLFISVLFHELAHAGAIALFGYGSSQIVLGGMGGLTINRRQARPWHDMLISLAGPLASFALAFLIAFLRTRIPYTGRDPMLIALLPILSAANLYWGIFNLIPVPPLDGGHVVRHFFRTFLPEKTAFVISVWIAIIVGIAVALLAVRTGFFFLALFMAWFVFNNYQQWQHYRSHGVPGD